MPVLTALNLSKDFRNKPLFSAVTFGIDWTDRVGLIGVNGSGKTTLIRVLAGEMPSDTGEVIVAEGAQIGYLPQEPKFDSKLSVLDALFSKSSAAMQLIHDYEAACAALAHDHANEKLLTQMTELSHQIDAAGAWELETNAKTILAQLGIHDTEQIVGTLSGGQRKRVALAHALIIRPDLLILDEPTNHLDAETIQWLEDYLARYSGALFLVTHDRYFLDRVTNRIVEIDRGTTQTFSGNYSYYLEKKEAEEMRRGIEYEKRKQLMKQELAWLRRGAKARTTKQKARVDRAEEMLSAPREKPKQEIEIGAVGRRLGTKVIEFEKVSKRYGHLVLVKDFTFILQRGDRIGIIGPNGTGKTTLLDMVIERIKPDAGKISLGTTVHVGYYDQENRRMNEDQRLIDYVKEAGENLPTAEGMTISASQMAERFLFPPAMQFAPISKLSGGERRRLYLLRLLMEAPNVLLLDEPTNDLDIPTLVALESYLDTFAGSVIAVSHDRYFLDRVVDRVLRFEGDGRIREYPGNYSAFLDIRDREERERLSAETPKKVSKQIEKTVEPKQRKLSFKEKKELDALESQITTDENRKSEIEAALNTSGSDYKATSALIAELTELSVRLDKALERWVELGNV
ncbi:MAG: ABC-F family ATP-binding cassette domain-containing protein [Bacteroidota bacterium]|nr:ABC-F family ATP-binding cassette domain-containing protein [Bacteroidota bacterium]MDP4233949.1 ABC-F family ATP-binding cassette domain-containing protein [Bacteroidota bacterium]MDP4242800.1 ABC-F family ATP-binding cassette domain-containing protein [Bacteroidota bacterium]MDP4288514.1 ABC-F family ATP-binding cassette domain-containing protein [Bacteroidota bacterium]